MTRNNRKAIVTETTRKPERPESWKSRKAGTMRMTRMFTASIVVGTSSVASIGKEMHNKLETPFIRFHGFSQCLEHQSTGVRWFIAPMYFVQY